MPCATPHTILRLILSGVLIAWSAPATATEWATPNTASTDASNVADIYFAPANEKSLVMLYNGLVVGKVAIFKHLGIMMLPVSKFTKTLGMPLKVNAENGTAQGTLPDGGNIMIIPRKDTVLVNGTEMKQVPGLMLQRGDEIYVDSSVIKNIFGLTVYVHNSSNTLRVSSEDGEAKPLSRQVGPGEEPPPDTSVQPVTAADLNASKPPPEATPPSTPTPPPAPSPAPASADTSAEESLVLQLSINNIEMEEFIEGAEKNGKLYLPLGQLTSLIDFAVTIDPTAKTAKGWFIREENTLFLTADSVSVKGDTKTLPPGSILAKDQDLFIDAELLSQWFPLNFSVNRYTMTLAVTTREPLPFEEKLLRKKRRDALEQQKTPQKEVTYKAVDYPYASANVPFVNLTVSPSYQSEGQEKRSDYSLLASGDLAYMTTRLYAGGNFNGDSLSDLRLTMGRSDYRRDLLGPLGASSFSMGDINSAGLSQVTQSNSGRGFSVNNRALDRSDKFDVTSFVGDSTPGWEVELYRNGTLINSQTIGANGRYEFLDIPILFGNNTFRLAFFGPQGQVDEIVKNINADSALLDAGEFTYNLSADQQNRTLFGVTDTSNQSADGVRAVGEFEYGINRWLTATVGGARTTIQSESHDYATGGVRTSLAGILMSLDGAYDTEDNGYSTRLAMFANYFDTDFHFQQKFAHDFISEESTAFDNPLTRLTDIGFDRQAALPLLGEFNTGLSLARKTFASGRVDHLWVNRFSKSFYGINFTNSLQYNYDNLNSEAMVGSTSLRGFYDRVLLGGQLDYAVKPNAQFNNVKITGAYPIVSGISGNTSLLKDLQTDKRAELENTVTFDVKKYKLSFTGRGDTNGEYFFGMSLNMSIGKIPDSDKWLFSSQNIAETGTVVVKPYLDRNYNQEWDEGESAPPKTSFKVGSQTLENDEDGYIVAKSLPTNMPVSVHMNAEKQENPFWTTGVDEYRVIPRPGTALVLEYPLFETSQIDGTLHAASGSPSGIKIELVNTEDQVVGMTHTAFDGYYLLQGVMPGNYKVRVAEESLNGRQLKQAAEVTVTIKESDFYTKDIALVGPDAVAADATPPPAPGLMDAAAATPIAAPKPAAKAAPAPKPVVTVKTPLPKNAMSKPQNSSSMPKAAISKPAY